MEKKRTLIFVVDDNEYEIKRLMHWIEKSLHCDVVGFDSAIDCIKNLDKEPDLILSDYYFTSSRAKVYMNGAEMLSIIKKDYPKIPVVMYSSKNSIELAVRLLQEGACDFIPRENTSKQNFMQIVSETLNRQLRKERIGHHEKAYKNKLIASVILFFAILFASAFYMPIILPYFIMGLIGISAVILFYRTLPKGKDHTTHHHP